jgi:Zn-dependent oligopeptidase
MSFINWLVAKIHPDFNKNGKDDVKEITEAANLALAKLQHAIQTIDYKTMIVHAQDIADALSVVAQNVERIRSLVDTPEVKAALHELLEVTNKCITLIGSFAAQNKVAMLEQKDEGIA